MGVQILRSAPDDHWTEFHAACDNVKWRYRAWWDHAEAYRACYRTLGPIEAIYETERHYFGTYNNGLSALESTLYSLHALLASTLVLGWPFEEEQKSRRLPRYILDQMARAPDSGESLQPLKSVLQELDSCSYWRACRNRRNRMYHRTRIPQHVAIGGGPPRFHLPATSSTELDPADWSSIETLVKWLSEKIHTLTEAGLQVIEHNQSARLTE